MRAYSILRHSCFPPLVAALFAGIGMLPTLRFAWHRLATVRGWEADEIARAIVTGHGFSFPGTERWLWPVGDAQEFFSTAWADPVFTYVLAGAHWLLGAHAYAGMYTLTFLCVGIILFCAYRIADRFGGPWAGVLAVALTANDAVLNQSFFSSISNVALASAALLCVVLVSIRYFEDPSLRRLVVLGPTMGFAILICPAAQYFLIALVLSLVVVQWRESARMMLHPSVLVLLALAVMAPWTLRNYVVFGEFVLVRTGAGQIAWAGTVGPAETFQPGVANSPLPAPWSSTGPSDAVQKMLDSNKRALMHQFQVEMLAASPPPGYDDMNEAQRDSWYLDSTKDFVRRHPLMSAEMALAKIKVFATGFKGYGVFVLVLAIVGALVTIHDRRSWPLTLLVVSYVAPFALIIPYFARYRAPIEPVLAILAAVALLWGLRRTFGHEGLGPVIRVSALRS